MTSARTLRAILFCSLLTACICGPVEDLRAQSSAVVLEAGREKFTVDQIAGAFEKNGAHDGKKFRELEYDSALAFLNLYANYRLKVQAAEDAGLADKQEIRDEIHSQRIQLAVPPAPHVGFLLERKLVDPSVGFSRSERMK